MHPYQHQIDACNIALRSVSDVIPAELQADVSGYINEFDEWGLGVEILIDQICEFDIQVNETQCNAIVEAMESMGLGDTDRVSHIKDQCDKL